MNIRIMALWDKVRTSFWFLPSMMTVGAVALSFATVSLDAAGSNDWLLKLGVAYSGGAEGASAVLSAISGSMISVAGLVFSMTLVALTLTSSQLGPRLLRTFMRDTATQMVLGTFVATFVYCLLVLRTIRHTGDNAFVPHLSVTIGVVFAVTSMAVLIYFIHHVATSIQADHVVARVSEELNDGVERLFPTEAGEAPTQRDEPPMSVFEHPFHTVYAKQDGYVLSVDTEELLELAVREDVVLRLERRPGQYVTKGGALMRVWPVGRASEALEKCLQEAFSMGDHRTPTQDIEYSVDQLVEVAVRALSPGINDPFTALACLDRLGSALIRLARACRPSALRLDEKGALRVVTVAADFDGITDAALNQIRQYGRGSVAVTLRLLETIALVAAEVRRPEDIETLVRHADMVARSGQSLPEENDREAVAHRYQLALAALRKGNTEKADASTE